MSLKRFLHLSVSALLASTPVIIFAFALSKSAQTGEGELGLLGAVFALPILLVVVTPILFIIFYSITKSIFNTS